MRDINQPSKIEKLIVTLYFAVASVELAGELFSNKLFLFVFKPLIPITLMLLYWNKSSLKNPLFFGIILFSMITNVFFIYDTEEMLFLGLLVFFIHRLLMIYYVANLINLKNYVPVLIAMIPFLFIFFYLLSVSNELTARTYYVVIIQNVLISILAGIILSHYMMFYNKKVIWLFIFGLLSISQYFIVFIEKYYLSGLSVAIFRPLAMILNAGVYFSFYKFVIVNEKLNHD